MRYCVRILSFFVLTVVCVATFLVTTPRGMAQDRAPKLYFDHAFQVETRYHGASLERVTPLSLASDDFDVDGVRDLAVGLATPSGGVIAIHRGNLDAFAPQSDTSFRTMADGRFLSPYLPDAQLVKIPNRPDFLAAGDFIGHNGPGIVAAARGGTTLHVLARGNSGKVELLQSLAVPGAITALDAHMLHPGKYWQVAVGVHTGKGSEFLIYTGSEKGLAPMSRFALASDVTAFAFGNLDGDSISDVLIVAGGEVSILHGGSQTVEPLHVPFSVAAATTGRFQFDRDSIDQMALLGTDGSLHLLVQDGIDSRPLTKQDFEGRRRMQALRPSPTAFVEREVSWKEIESVPSVAGAGSDHAPRIFRTRISNSAADDVVAFGSTRLSAVMHPDTRPDTGVVLDRSDLAVGAVAALPARVNIDNRYGLVVLTKGSAAPLVVPPSSDPIFINRTDDPAPTSPIANACNNTSNSDTSSSCSLREAILKANATTSNPTVMIAAGTYTLTRPKVPHDFTGNNGTLEVKSSMNIVGAGAASTIIQAGTSSVATCIAAFTWPGPPTPIPNTSACNNVDKVFSFNQDITPAFCSPSNPPAGSTGDPCLGDTATNASVSVSGVTIQNGFNRGETGGDADGFGGGFDFDTGSSGTATLTLTGCIIQNNSASQGGAMTLFNFTNPNTSQTAPPTVTISNSTIQGNVAFWSNPNFVNLERGEVGSGGGIEADVDSRLVLTASTVSNNAANQISSGPNGVGTIDFAAGGVGGLLLLGQLNTAFDQIHSSTISGNTSVTAGGGIDNTAKLVIDTGTVISGNQAVAEGAGLDSDEAESFTSKTTPPDTVTISNVTFTNNTLVSCTNLNTATLCSELNAFAPTVVSGGGAIHVGNLSGSGPLSV